MRAGMHGWTGATRAAHRMIAVLAALAVTAVVPAPAHAAGLAGGDPFASLTVPQPSVAAAGAQRVAVSLPIWDSRYDWAASDGYAGWTPGSEGPNPDGYGFAPGLGGRPGLWLWLTGGREYRPGHGEWRLRAPGTTRIASADLTLSYADKLFAHHCVEVGLRTDAEPRDGQRTCSPPELPATQERWDVSLSDPSDRPTTKEAYVRVEMPQCKNPRDTACSKWIPPHDPLTNGAFTRIGRVEMVLVDDDLPVPVASGPFRDLDEEYINGRESYRLDVAVSDAGAGVKRSTVEHTGQGTLVSQDAACDPRHLTPELGARVCPPSLTYSTVVDTTPMPEGRRRFDVTGEDPAGNLGRSAAWHVRIDRTAPSAPADLGFVFDDEDATVHAFWDSGEDPLLVDGTPGSGHAGDEYRVRRGSSEADPGSFTDWAPANGSGAELADGRPGERIEIEVRSVDAVGNVSTNARGVYVVETSAPRQCGITEPGKRCPTADEVIVQLTSEADAGDIERMRSRASSLGEVDEYETFPAFSATLDPTQVDELEADPQVKLVTPNRKRQKAIASASRYFGVADARPDFGVNGDTNGDLDGYSRSEPTIAILDTGIDDRHRDLDGGKIVGWHDPVGGTSDPYDPDGHGTHVASIAAAAGDADSRYRGVAYGAPIYGIKVFSDDPDLGAEDRHILEGIDHAIQARQEFMEEGEQFPGVPAVNIRVINMSLGGPPHEDDGRDAFADAIRRAEAAGIVTVVAAGNEGPRRTTIGSPGAAPQALTVANMADVGVLGFNLERTSSRGPTINPEITGMKPDVSGPGVSIAAAFPCPDGLPENKRCEERAFLTGTSMASPFAAGLAALMLEENTGLTPGAIRDTIERTARDWGVIGDDIDFGFGRLDAYEAIDAVSSKNGTGPSLPTHSRGNHLLTRDDGRHEVEFTARERAPLAITLLKVSGQEDGRISIGLWRGDCGDTEVKKPRSTEGRQLTIRTRPGVTGRYCARITGDVNEPTRVSWDISRRTA